MSNLSLSLNKSKFKINKIESFIKIFRDKMTNKSKPILKV